MFLSDRGNTLFCSYGKLGCIIVKSVDNMSIFIDDQYTQSANAEIKNGRSIWE